MVKQTKRVHDGMLSVRASQKLVDQARQAAHNQGMSLSEAIRQSLRELAEHDGTEADFP